ncbi:creatininase family protein [Streptomyces sp. NBRC 110465]|uniref:creatininase family protein n=1 Tax=Streptomyces sp. NBRC 110465 TaxID=1897621 RepID=UPI0009334FFE|nr:creatininase family protein [Streptomyces sp. NBRC 110465]
MLISDMTWPDLNPGPDTHAIIPVGALEPHGPHLPLGSDTMISDHFARRLAAAVAGHVAPAVGYGVATPAQRLGGTFPGVISITGATFTALVTDVLTALARHGYRRLILLNSAIDNIAFLCEAARHLTENTPGARVMIVNWWDVVGEDFRNALAHETGTARADDHHAGMVESSLVMHISPHTIRRDRLPADGGAEQPRRISYHLYPQPADTTTSTGIVYTAAHASPELGERVADQVAHQLADAVLREFAAPLPS